MRSGEHVRRPTGSPDSSGGQFAASPRPERVVRLDDPLRPRVDAVRDLVERAAPVNLHDEHVLSREAARVGVREVLLGMTETEFDRHWALLEQAAVALQRFALDEDGEASDGANPAELCGVNAEDFRSYDEPDRFGETGSSGHDWPAVSEAVAVAWSEVLHERVSAAVRADAFGGTTDGAPSAAA